MNCRDKYFRVVVAKCHWDVARSGCGRTGEQKGVQHTGSMSRGETYYSLQRHYETIHLACSCSWNNSFAENVIENWSHLLVLTLLRITSIQMEFSSPLGKDLLSYMFFVLPAFSFLDTIVKQGNTSLCLCNTRIKLNRRILQIPSRCAVSTDNLSLDLLRDTLTSRFH